MKKNTVQKGKVLTPDNQSIAIKLIAGILQCETSHVLVNKQGRTLSFTQLDKNKDGQLLSDVEACNQVILEASLNDPMIDMGAVKLKCSALESIENHKGRDHKGLIFRGENDVILAFIPISTAEKRDLVVSKLHAALESYEHGKFMQPDLAGIF
ncbi:hypothetical protein VA249_01070 [Vibrio alfacsensis]|uniref:hypothetical protein n=1 Tax=Vibrio alfacsensis TaxID=1074311 RepID=UPI001BF01FC1|nr:hypothetical protein [Vibrio alfacsensis]BBM63461.1 hypothetical protein VA249_01070 [Vibrio alfacsensis]